MTRFYLIERRDEECYTLQGKRKNHVAIVSSLDKVTEAIAIYLRDYMEPEDDVGEWHFCILRVNVDDFSPQAARAVQSRDRHNKIISEGTDD